MKKNISALVVIVALSSGVVLSRGGNAVAFNAIDTCKPAKLVISTGPWIPEYATAGTVESWLPIAVTNLGTACVFGGVPTIVPYQKTPHALKSAALDSTEVSTLLLSHDKSAYTYLRLDYPISPKSIAEKWVLSCEPSTAFGFSVTVGPVGHVLSRTIRVSLSKVCMNSKATDLHTAPLSSKSINS